MNSQEKFIKALEMNGISFNDGKFTKLSSYNANDPNIDEKLQFFTQAHQRRQYDINSELNYKWANTLSLAINELVSSNPHWGSIKAFWIHLCQILVEQIYSRQEQLEFYKKLLPDPKLWEISTYEPKSDLYHLIHINATLDNIKKLFTNGELIYIDFKRQSECHIVQTAYDVRLSKKEKFLDKRSFLILGKGTDDNGISFSIEEINDILKNILKKYPNNNETLMAIDFANRIREHRLDINLTQMWNFAVNSSII